MAATWSNPSDLERLWWHVSAAQDRGVLRIAGWMTAAAAAVLIAVLLVRNTGRTEAAARPAIWQTVAVMPAMDANEDANRDLVVMAQWMADDLSSGEQW